MARSYIESLFENIDPNVSSGVRGPRLASPTPTGVGEVFGAGVKSGAEGLAADTEYFKALFNTVTGDDEAAAANVRRARVTEQAAAAPLLNVETFEEFLNEPTLSGFVTQVAKSTGQLLPSAASSITGAGVGALAGRAAFSLGGKKAVEKLVKDSVERTIKDVADPDEKAIAEASYNYLKRGALGGAFTAEYVPLSGSNLSEALDSGRDLDTNAAVRAATVGVPQAAIGVGGEVALLKLIGNVAKKRSVKDGDIFANLAKDIGATTIRGAAIEGTTEVAQEGIAILNRMSMDDTFDAEQAKLRLAESAFAGFFGGGAIGGVAGTTVPAVKAAIPAATSAANTAIDKTANVVDKAKRMLDEARGQRVEEEIVREQANATSFEQTSPEPASDINAQLNAMVDPTSDKKAVWVAGNEAQYSARTNKVTPVEVNGKSAFAAFIPGRGTIISTSKDVVSEVVAGGATDAVVGAALGYSSTKDYGNATLVARALDAEGNVVSEELTTAENAANALAAARGLAPEGGSATIVDAQQALEERAKKVNREAKVNPVDDDPDSFEEPDPNETPNFESESEELAAQRADLENSQEIEGETIEVASYEAKADPSRVFDNEADARQAYEDEFGETDFDALEGVSAAALNAAARESRENPNAVVSLTKEGNKFVIRKTFYDKLYADGPGRKFTLPQFIAEQAKRAGKAKPNRQSVIIKRPDGTTTRASLVSLVNAGRRLVENREGSRFEGEQGRVDMLKQGLAEILSDLAVEGYDVQDLNGLSLLKQANYTNGKFNGLNMVAGQLGDTSYRLSFLQTARFVETSNEPDVAVRLMYNDDKGETVGKEVRTSFDNAEQVADRLMQEGATLDPERAKNGFYIDFGDPRDRDQGEGDFDIQQESTLEDARPDPNQRSRGGAPGNLGPDNRANPDPAQTTPEPEVAPEPAPETPARDPSKFNDPMVNQSISQLLERLKMKVAPRIFNFNRLSEMTDEQLRAAVGDQDFPAAKQIVDRMKANDQIGGSYFRGVILVRDVTGNPLSTMMTAAHEIGHHLYQTEQQAALANNALRPRLLQAYERHPEYKTYVDRYADKGFEEWYADQVSRWATKEYINRTARNMPERHFKAVAKKLKAAWRAMSRGFRIRKGPKAPAFEQYMEQVVGTRKEATKEAIGFQEKALVAAVNEAVVKEGGEALANHWRRQLGKRGKHLMKFVATADGVLRLYGGDKIADMFYVRAQDETGGGRLGMLKAAALKKDELIQKFQEDVGSLDSQEVIDALRRAANDDMATSELDDLAKKVRLFLDEMYTDYIEPSNSDIGRRENFFPVALNLLEIAERPDDFKNLILEKNPGISPERAEKAIHRLRQYAQTIQGESVVLPDDADPASEMEKSRLLTDNINQADLRNAGFAMEPADALVNYVSHMVKRVEFNKATNNKADLDAELAKLDPEERAAAMQVINTYLGYQANPISPFWRQVNSWGQWIQFVTLLPLATIGSLPELAGPVINSKEFSLDNFYTAMKEIVSTIRDRDEAKQFAKDIGVVTNEAAANAWITQAEQDYMTDTARQMTDKFFRVIGLDFYTKFTREFASGMGRQFILKHAKGVNPRSERYLRELGLTKADVEAWIDSGQKLSTPEGKKVKQAVQRFVESSILRPNSAERPIWASDPRWALVWQLKSYFYAYSKVITGGILREAKARAKEGQGGIEEATATLAVFGLTAVATMPLAMLGMELREYIKYGVAWALPGIDANTRYFRTDRMDWDEYLFETVDKSGFLGPLSLGVMANQSAEYGKSPIVSLLGPTAETVDEAFRNGWRVDQTIRDRMII